VCTISLSLKVEISKKKVFDELKVATISDLANQCCELVHARTRALTGILFKSKSGQVELTHSVVKRMLLLY